MPKVAIQSIPDGTQIYVHGKILRSKLGSLYTDSEIATLKQRRAQYGGQFYAPQGNFGEIAIQNATLTHYDPQTNDWVDGSEGALLDQWFQEETFVGSRHPERGRQLQRYLSRLQPVMAMHTGAQSKGGYILNFPKDADGNVLELAPATDVVLYFQVATYSHGNQSGKTSYLNGIYVLGKPVFVSPTTAGAAARLATNLGIPLIPAPDDEDVDTSVPFTKPAAPDTSVIPQQPAPAPVPQPVQQATAQPQQPVYQQPYPQQPAPNYGQAYGSYPQAIPPTYGVGQGEPQPGITPQNFDA